MLNRMCSEAELAVGMRAIISSSKRANVTLQFAPFGDGLVSFDLPQVPFPSVTPHAVKHGSPPSGTGLTPIHYTPKLRMNRKWQNHFSPDVSLMMPTLNAPSISSTPATSIMLL